MKHDSSLRNDTIYLHHICDEVDFLLTISKDLTYEGLIQDPVLSRAIIRSLEVMGEASRNLSTDWKCQYPAIPWQKITDTRNRLIHGYFNVSLLLIWEILQTDIPQLSKQLKFMMPER